MRRRGGGGQPEVIEVWESEGLEFNFSFLEIKICAQTHEKLTSDTWRRQSYILMRYAPE